MKISIIGTGYVGLVSGTCFSEVGHDVVCIDINKEKIGILKEGKVPIYEPGLSEILERNVKVGRLNFSIDCSSCRDSEIIFLAVGTPSTYNGKGRFNMS